MLSDLLKQLRLLVQRKRQQPRDTIASCLVSSATGSGRRGVGGQIHIRRSAVNVRRWVHLKARDQHTLQTTPTSLRDSETPSPRHGSTTGWRSRKLHTPSSHAPYGSELPSITDPKTGTEQSFVTTEGVWRDKFCIFRTCCGVWVDSNAVSSSAGSVSAGAATETDMVSRPVHRPQQKTKYSAKFASSRDTAAVSSPAPTVRSMRPTSEAFGGQAISLREKNGAGKRTLASR